jgi:carbamoyltransferase
MVLLGISAYYHDSAAALIRDGAIVAAAQEERFSRHKHDRAFPHQALSYCLREARIAPQAVDQVVFYEKPFLKFDRLVETWLAFAPRGFAAFRAALPVWLGERLFLKNLLARELRRAGLGDGAARLLFAQHHDSHAASAFYPSPFNDAAVLTVDGVGEWTTTRVSMGSGKQIKALRELRFPHSLGLLYSAFTTHIGFEVNSGEYKLMGLAPYGQARHLDAIFDHLIDLKPDGSFRLDQQYFNYCTGLSMTSPRFAARFGPARRPGEPLTQHHADLAASVQAATEQVLLRLTRGIARDTGARHLCLAGGVALNCVANGKILRDAHFEKVWIQPAAGDAGAAIGAALHAYYGLTGAVRTLDGRSDGMQGACLGPAFEQAEIEADLNGLGAPFEVMDDAEMIACTARALADGQVVGWMQGRMEFGPRALGCRSILADPRVPGMRDRINTKIKQRETFRPFAPAVLREDAAEWFDLHVDSPYMLLVAEVAAGHRRPAASAQGFVRLDQVLSDIPAVTHVDHSARVQTVSAQQHPRFYALLAEFKALTGCPVLLNTSFNGDDEPIVCTPADAVDCFKRTGLDLLVIGNCVLARAST